ncbi:MAG: hypothetical protein J5752_02505 [Clostridiales bacterium]|nr:hypothetical protein [Clostridiales bacterium]
MKKVLSLIGATMLVVSASLAFVMADGSQTLTGSTWGEVAIFGNKLSSTTYSGAAYAVPKKSTSKVASSVEVGKVSNTGYMYKLSNRASKSGTGVAIYVYAEGSGNGCWCKSKLTESSGKAHTVDRYFYYKT